MISKGSVKMGKSKRPDHFVKKGSEEVPGPGSVIGASYSSFDLKKGVTIEGKRKEVSSFGPGPGEYNTDKVNLVKKS